MSPSWQSGETNVGKVNERLSLLTRPFAVTHFDHVLLKALQRTKKEWRGEKVYRDR